MARDGRIEIKIRGAREIERALSRLPKQARDEARDGMGRISRDLANRIRAAGRASDRQSANASRTVRARRGLTPGVIAGPHPLLFGSEFGVKRRFGWYAHRRYHNSRKRQFRPHLGGKSYWFFRTKDESGGLVDEECRAIADRIIERWSA